MKNEDLFYKLLKTEDESDVESILNNAGYGSGVEGAYRPLGDMENNFSTVGNQQNEPTGALVEKLINGIDANLLGEAFKRSIDPEGQQAPATMSEAVEKFYNVRRGRLENLTATEQTALAENLHMVAVGDKKTPCYLIVDRGEGQTPARFPDTFLSLNKSNKMRIPFVQGKFNAGGTGVLQFCGEKNMQLIVSKRHPNAPVKHGDTTKELWGFTIVRRQKPSDGRRSSMYVYLAPDKGNVLAFSANEIKVLPEKLKGLRPKPYSLGIAYGTCVKLYNFRWRARTLATTEARYELERFLHAPCLPFRLTETREYNANYFSTTISGVWASVGGADPDATKLDLGPAYADLNLRNIGNMPYGIVVFKEDSDPRRVPHGVFFTVNGQVHGALPADFVSRYLKFDYLKDHLLVTVDCTGMDPMVREDFFMASRDRVRKNEVYDELVDKLKAALRDHPGLADLNAIRRRKAIEDAMADEGETENVFAELLKSDPSLATLLSGGDRLITTMGPGDFQPFRPKQFPSFFRLVKNPKDGLVKQCPVNRTCRVEFETDAADDYFKRADCPGKIYTEPANLIEQSQLWHGRFNAQFRVPWDTKPGHEIKVKVVVEDIETETKGKAFVSEFTIIALPETEERPGGGGGTRTSSGRQPNTNGSKTEKGLAIPKVQEVHKPETPFVAMEIKHDDKGGYEFFLNLDNASLITEMSRAKDDEKPIVKHWFKYGLALCAIGMIQEQKRAHTQAETGAAVEDYPENKEQTDDLAAVSRNCNGLARVIVPVIRALYRGPQPGT